MKSDKVNRRLVYMSGPRVKPWPDQEDLPPEEDGSDDGGAPVGAKPPQGDAGPAAERELPVDDSFRSGAAISGGAAPSGSRL